MAAQIDYNDPRYAQAAAEILRRHDNGEPEANITSAVRDFLILTGLASGEEMVEENPPAQGSRRAVDLTALDTFIEFKRRIGTTGGFNPNAEYVQQLDDYLEPIPEFDAGKPLRVTVSEAGAAAAAGTKARLDELWKKRGDRLTVTIARREIRKWLRESAEGKAVERTVGEFLEKNVDAHSSS